MSRNTIWVLQNNAIKEKKEPLLGSRRGGERRKSCSLSIMSGVAIIDWFGWFNWWADRSGLCFISLIKKFWGTKTRVITIMDKAEFFFFFFTFLFSFLAAVVLLKWKQSRTQITEREREREEYASSCLRCGLTVTCDLSAAKSTSPICSALLYSNFPSSY